MAKGEGQQVRVLLKGKHQDLVLYAESEAAVKQWKEDKTIQNRKDAVQDETIFVTKGYATPLGG